MSTTMTDTTAPRLRPDGRPMMLTVTWLLVLVGVAALAAGWPGLAWGGRLAGFPGPMAHLAPVIVDGVIVVLTLAAVARRGHGERARWMWSTVAVLVAGSAAVQVAHALDTTPAAGGLQLGVAATLAALPPLIVVVATHAWLDLAVAPAPSRRRAAAAHRQRPAAAPAPAAASTPATAAASTPAAPKAPRPTSAPRTRDDDALRAEVRRLRMTVGPDGRQMPFARIADVTGVPVSTAKRWARDVTVDDAEQPALRAA